MNIHLAIHSHIVCSLRWVRPPKVAGNRKIDENASTRQRIAERLADQLLRESNGKVTVGSPWGVMLFGLLQGCCLLLSALVLVDDCQHPFRVANC